MGHRKIRIPKRRRNEKKTDYKARTAMLKSEKPRIVFRKTNRYIIGQLIKSKEAKDEISIGVNSKQLIQYGWPEKLTGSLKSLPACYLTGFLLGKKVIDKEGEIEVIFDIGLLRSIYKSRIYAFLKGVIDAGVKINYNKEIIPEEKRLRGEHLKNSVSENFDQIKKQIEKQ